MSGTVADDPEDLDTLAAEYVLGVLDLAEMRGVRVRARQDPAMAAAVVAWELRLAPLTAAVPPQAPPSALWERIERRIAMIPDETVADNSPSPAALPPAVVAPMPLPREPIRAAPANDPVPLPAPAVFAPGPRRTTVRGLRAWQAATAAALALAAAFAGIAFLPGIAPGGARVAAITPIDTKPTAFVAAAQPDGSVVLTALTPAEVPPDRDLELWILPPGAKGVASLGVLPVTGRTLRLPSMPPTGTQLLISLEPRGGSPTGQPTGPVLYAGTLASS